MFQKAEEELQGYEIPAAEGSTLMKRLDAFACKKVEASAHEAANTALPRMKERFSEVCVLLHPLGWLLL